MTTEQGHDAHEKLLAELDKRVWGEKWGHLTEKQIYALQSIHRRYNIDEWNPRDFWHPFDLPEGWVAGWLTSPGGSRLYFGVSPDGQISS